MRKVQDLPDSIYRIAFLVLWIQYTVWNQVTDLMNHLPDFRILHLSCIRNFRMTEQVYAIEREESKKINSKDILCSFTGGK